MPLISDATAVYAGDLAAQAVYMGDDLVWAPAPAGPEGIPGCVMALNAVDAPVGEVVSWPDRSPLHNDMLSWYQNAQPVIGNGSFVHIMYLSGSFDSHMVSARAFDALAGNHSSHTLLLSRHTGRHGSFMTWGAGGGNGGTVFDLWLYNDGGLIWHGSGPGFDTIPGPQLPLNTWVLIDVSFDATTGLLSVCVDELPPDTLTVTLNTTSGVPMYLGMGSYSAASDFDLAELYVYDRVLAPEERAEVRAHLYDLIPTRLAWL